MTDWYRAKFDEGMQAHAKLDDNQHEGPLPLTLCRTKLGAPLETPKHGMPEHQICPVCARLLRGDDEIRYRGPRSMMGTLTSE